MSIISLIPRLPTIWPGGFGNPSPPPIVFDASVREDHPRESEITDSPVDGPVGPGIVSDHIQPGPLRCEVMVVASKYPDSEVVNVQATRHLRIWRQCEMLWQSRAIFDFTTSTKIYTNMAIRRLDNPRTMETTHTLVFPMSLRKVESGGVDTAQQMADAAAELALGVQDIGAQAVATAVFALVNLQGVVQLESRAQRGITGT